jgi:toxin YoeB
MKVVFHERAWADYVAWQSEDKKTLRAINSLIKDIQRNGVLKGIGKPERLRHVDAYSRRIDERNRLTYREASDGTVEIISCKGHYLREP